MSSNDWLAGRHALLTGAGAGLALAVSRAFLDAGARCTLCAPERAPGEAVKALRSFAGSRVNYLCCDPQDADGVESMMSEAHARFGAVQIFFNHLMSRGARPCGDAGAAARADRIRSDLRAQQVAMQAALRYMLACGSGGTVVNVALLPPLDVDLESRADFDAAIALMAFTREAAGDVASLGIRVNGLVVQADPLHEACRADGLACVPWFEPRQAPWPGLQASKDATAPYEQVVHAALFLASDRSRSMTGQTLEVNCTGRFASALPTRGSKATSI